LSECSSSPLHPLPQLHLLATTTNKKTGKQRNRKGKREFIGDLGALESKLIYRSYISDANAQRKYEDGKALQEALNEIRAEIARVTSGAVR